MSNKAQSNPYASIDAYREDWQQVILATGPADRDVVESAIQAIYTLCHKDKPEFVWVQSPRLAVEYLAQHGSIDASYHDFPWRFIQGADDDEEVDNRLRAPLRRLVRCTHAFVWVAIDYWAEGRLWNRMAEMATDAAKAVYKNRTSTTVGHALASRLETEIKATIQRVLDYTLNHATVLLDQGMGGSSDAPWIAYRLYMHEHVKPIDSKAFPDYLPMLRHLETVSRNTGRWYAGPEVCVVSERPTHIHIDEVGRLHSPDADTPALAFADGWAVYMAHGEVIPSAANTMRVRAQRLEDWQFDVEDAIWEGENDE